MYQLPILSCGFKISLIFENLTYCYTSHHTIGLEASSLEYGGLAPLQSYRTKRASTRLLHGGYRCEFQSTSADGNPELQNQTWIGTQHDRAGIAYSSFWEKRNRWCTLQARNDEKCQKSNLQVMGDVPLASRHTSWCIACPVLVLQIECRDKHTSRFWHKAVEGI